MEDLGLARGLQLRERCFPLTCADSSRVNISTIWGQEEKKKIQQVRKTDHVYSLGGACEGEIKLRDDCICIL